MDPPRAFPPLIVSYSCAVSKSQTMSPEELAYARKCPSIDPSNTPPGIADTAADCAGLQFLRSPQLFGDALHTVLPETRSSANNPPPFSGLTSYLPVPPPEASFASRNPMSDIATY